MQITNIQRKTMLCDPLCEDRFVTAAANASHTYADLIITARAKSYALGTVQTQAFNEINKQNRS